MRGRPDFITATAYIAAHSAELIHCQCVKEGVPVGKLFVFLLPSVLKANLNFQSPSLHNGLSDSVDLWGFVVRIKYRVISVRGILKLQIIIGEYIQ